MNPYLQSTVLGIVEGLTEFLPVSSTAHLRISEALMHIPLKNASCAVGDASCLQNVAYWDMYTIVIQSGAIIALILIYLTRILDFFRTFPKGESGDKNILTHPIGLTIVAFIVTTIPTLLLRKWSDAHLGSLAAIAWALVIGGVIMWAVDAWAARQDPSTEHIEDMNLFHAIWIGLCQSLSAIFPGVSRSMSTIASAQLVGLDRPSALEFSFLLSIPTMLAATGYEFIKEVHPSRSAQLAGEVHAHVTMNGERWLVLLIGFVVSFIVAYVVVEWFLAWVRKHGFTIFAVYRILAGGALLIWGAKYIGQ